MPFSEILTALPLNIDWQQILLHLLNFLLLSVGLGLLVYLPVKKFLEARRKKYEDRDREIEEKRQSAEDMQAEYTQRLQGVDDEIAHKRAVAKREADDAAVRTMESADARAAEILSRAADVAEAQKRKLIDEAGADITDMVVTATEKLLAVSQNENTDAVLYDRFISENNSASSAAETDIADRSAELEARKADIEAKKIIADARESAGREADKILDAAKDGFADIVALAAEKLLSDADKASDSELYDKFLAEAARGERK